MSQNLNSVADEIRVLRVKIPYFGVRIIKNNYLYICIYFSLPEQGVLRVSYFDHSTSIAYRVSSTVRFEQFALNNNSSIGLITLNQLI